VKIVGKGICSNLLFEPGYIGYNLGSYSLLLIVRKCFCSEPERLHTIFQRSCWQESSVKSSTFCTHGFPFRKGIVSSSHVLIHQTSKRI
jgi:hypothetical protein